MTETARGGARSRKQRKEFKPNRARRDALQQGVTMALPEDLAKALLRGLNVDQARAMIRDENCIAHAEIAQNLRQWIGASSACELVSEIYLRDECARQAPRPK